MSHIVLGFSRSDHWISKVVSWLTRGRYSHVMLLNPDTREYIEASGLAKPSGVRVHQLEEFFARIDWDFRIIPHPDPERVWRVAKNHVGKSYDWGYLFGWLFRRNWQDPDKWACNELITYACEMAGHPIIDMSDPQWLTPHHLYLISHPMDDEKQKQGCVV